jgi:hypothetical protein
MKPSVLKKYPAKINLQTPFQQFCGFMLQKYENPNNISVEVFAREFLRFFDLLEYVRLEDITELCSAVGITTEVKDLPRELRGSYAAYDGEYLIVYPTSRWNGFQLIGLLHELRELMSCVFNDLNSDITIPPNLESLSESFASAVVMQKRTFTKDVMQSFFNPILLQRTYGLSYHFILYRMIRVFDKVIPLSVSMFQNAKLLALSQTTASWREYMSKVRWVHEAEDPEGFVLTLSSQTSRFNSRGCFTLYHGFVPKKNSSIISCQHALNVLESGENALDQRYLLPSSLEYPEIRQAELISDGFLSTHAGVPANIILISMPECFRRKYDLKWVKPSSDPLMRNIQTLGETLGEIFQDMMQVSAQHKYS